MCRLPAGDNSSITREKLELILEAARWAPTHKLTEPWHFVVIGGSQKEAFEVGLLQGAALNLHNTGC